jgi:hypothetical protein
VTSFTRIWLAAFVPAHVPGLTMEVPDGSGRTMIASDSRPGAGFLTDQRPFSASADEPARLRVETGFELASGPAAAATATRLQADHQFDSLPLWDPNARPIVVQAPASGATISAGAVPWAGGTPAAAGGPVPHELGALPTGAKPTGGSPAGTSSGGASSAGASSASASSAGAGSLSPAHEGSAAVAVSVTRLPHRSFLRDARLRTWLLSAGAASHAAAASGPDPAARSGFTAVPDRGAAPSWSAPPVDVHLAVRAIWPEAELARRFGELLFEGVLSLDPAARRLEFQGVASGFPAFELYVAPPDHPPLAVLQLFPVRGPQGRPPARVSERPVRSSVRWR